jgi:hypothetical protein
MSITIRARAIAKEPRRLSGPPVLFAAALGMAAITFALGARTLSPALPLPVAVTALFGFAALVALLAWLRGDAAEQPRVSYWDVAGALTLIGIVASAAIEPEQLAGLVDSAQRPAQ